MTSTSQRPGVYAGLLRDTLHHSFWATTEGRTFFRLLDPSTVLSIVHQLLRGSVGVASCRDECVLAVDRDVDGVHVDEDTVEVAMTPLLLAALTARQSDDWHQHASAPTATDIHVPSCAAASGHGSAIDRTAEL